MFSTEQRDRIKDRLLEMGRSDSRIVSAALVGSSATGGDRWSDLDVTFGLKAEAKLEPVLSDWTASLRQEFDAVHLFDLPHWTSLYRVFLFPGNLQVDVSFTPEADFGANGPRFKLVFGKATEKARPQQPTPQHLFGYAVHHLVRARFCIERGRLWQAEYWISAARDYVLALACLQRGLSTDNGRGFDSLPGDVTRPLAGSLVRSLGRRTLLGALEKTVEGLLENSRDVGEPALRLKGQLRNLSSHSLGD
ncbi:MAG: hypothetical protein JRN28_02505 [Nitrososphaerota archaeon]|nr:hypothetical protein [Nitrososphaerota archaeon]